MHVDLWLFGTAALVAVGLVVWLAYCRWAYKTLPPDVAEQAVSSAGRFYPLRRTQTKQP